jgi:hypothetical protein
MTRFVLGLLAAAALAHSQSFIFDHAQRRFSFSGLHEARLGVEVDGKTLWADAASSANWDAPSRRLQLTFSEPAVVWAVDFGVDTISSTMRNAGTQPVRFGRCYLADGELRLGPGAEKTTALVMSGWHNGSGVETVRASGKHRLSRTLTQLYNPVSKEAFQLGFVSFDRVTAVHEVWWDEADRSLRASSYCDFEGFLLAPGATVASETLRLHGGADPFESLSSWADLVQTRYRPAIWPKIPAGWLGWSWVDTFHSENYEEVVRRNARAVRERLPGLDIEYLWVSIGNLEDGRAGNWLRWNRKNFPSGPQALVRDLGRLDFKLGLWSGAFWLNSHLTEDIERMRDALLMRDGKPLTVPNSGLGDMYVLDPTHPKTKEYLKNVFSTYREWGVHYYMIDFLYAISGTTPGDFVPDHYYDQSLIHGPQAYREGLKTIREAAGTDTYLLSSTGPTLLNIGLMDAVRTGNDYGEGRSLDGPARGFYPATFMINNPRYWTSHLAASNAMAAHFFTHRKLFLADSGNVFTIDKPIARQDAEITATIFGINGSPLMLGDDIERISPDRLEMIKQQFPRMPECAVPLDLFESPAPDYPKVFDLKVNSSWDQWDMVAVFNYGSKPLERKIAFERLGLDAGRPQLVWDFWNGRYLGAHSGAVELSVAPYSVSLLRIARARMHPWVISTDMHVRQGQAEIVDSRWDATRQALTIKAARPAGYRGNVFVHVPKGLALQEPAGLWIAKDANDGSLIVRCAFEFKDGAAVERTLRFTTAR